MFSEDPLDTSWGSSTDNPRNIPNTSWRKMEVRKPTGRMVQARIYIRLQINRSSIRVL